MKKRLSLLAFFLFAGFASAQTGVRISSTVTVSYPATNVNFVTIPAGATISFCNAPANATPCTNKATTYTDATLGTSCPLSQQLVLDNTNTCTSSPDAQGNWGVWVASGQYAYTITLANGNSLGPHFVTAGGSGGGGGSPGGSNLQVQFNNSGSFGGSQVTVDSATKSNLTIPGTLAVTGNATVDGTTGGNVFGKIATTGPVIYACPVGLCPTASDSNDGKSWLSAKATLVGALMALPGANASAAPPQFGYGTVYYTSSAVNPLPVNATSSCGLFVMDSLDPNFSSPPNSCWYQRQTNANFSNFNIVGVGCSSSFATDRAAQCPLIGGGTDADNNHPILWLEGSGFTFQNVGCVGSSSNSCEVKLSIDSNGDRNGDVAFTNSSFYDSAFEMGAFSATIGPAIDIGSNAFEVNVIGGAAAGNPNATSGTDAAQAVVINPGTGIGSGNINFQHFGLVNGSIKLYPGNATWGGDIFDDFVTENIVQGHGAIWISSTNGAAVPITVKTIFPADGTGTPCEVDGTGPSDATVVIGSLCTGPTIRFGIYESGLQTTTQIPSKTHQNGFLAGHMLGQDDSGRRGFSPSAVRFTNLAATNSSSWNCGGCGAGTITTGITAPDGTTGAARFSSSGAEVPLYFYNQSTTFAVGDYVIIGGWARSGGSAGWWAGGVALGIGVTGGNAPGFDFVDISGQGTPAQSETIPGYIQGDCTGTSPPCQWDWYSHAYKVTSTGTNPVAFFFNGDAAVNFTADYYGPIFLHISAGSIDDNEAAEIALNLRSYDAACNVGEICSLGNEALHILGNATFGGTVTQTNAAGGGIQCAQYNNSGVLSPTGSACGGGSGGLFTSYQFNTSTPITGSNIYLQTTYPSTLFSTAQTGSGTSGSPYVDVITLASQTGYDVFANCTGSSAAPTFCAMNINMLPTGIPNANLANPSTTVNSQTCTLGSSCSVTAYPPGYTSALTGQVLTALNGGNSSFQSPGISDGNGGAPVATTPYTVKCDSSTTLLDRGTVIRLQSGASVVTIPLSTGTGCPHLTVRLIDDNAGTITVNRSSTDTFTVTDGVTSTDGATTFTMTSGQQATLSNGVSSSSGIWEVQLWDGNSSQVNGAGIPASACALSTNGSKQVATLTCTGSGNVVLATSPTLTTPNLGTPSTINLSNATSLPCGALPALTGDTTSSSGSCATTTAKINGTSFSGTSGDAVKFGAGNTPVDSSLAMPTAAGSATVAQLIANGTATMGTGAISSGTCATVVTTSATGVATTDTIVYTPNADPTAVTGYAPSASGSLYIWAYPTSGNVNFRVCNNTSGSITPSALTLNWRVAR